jgi:hypothetical protein
MHGLCSSHEIVSLKIHTKIGEPPVYFSGSNEPIVSFPSSNGWTIPLRTDLKKKVTIEKQTVNNGLQNNFFVSQTLNVYPAKNINYWKP